MTDRERLIELFSQPMIVTDCCNKQMIIEAYADRILADGWIRLPCKVGDTVYCLDIIVDIDKCKGCEHYYEGGMGDHPCCEKTRYGDRAAECIEIKERVVTFSDICWWLSYNNFNKLVFLTREEAEKALAERREQK